MLHLVMACLKAALSKLVLLPVALPLELKNSLRRDRLLSGWVMLSAGGWYSSSGTTYTCATK